AVTCWPRVRRSICPGSVLAKASTWGRMESYPPTGPPPRAKVALASPLDARGAKSCSCVDSVGFSVAPAAAKAPAATAASTIRARIAADGDGTRCDPPAWVRGFSAARTTSGVGRWLPGERCLAKTYPFRFGESVPARRAFGKRLPVELAGDTNSVPYL